MRLRKMIAIGCMLLLCVCCLAEGELEIHFLDVGQADSAVVMCGGQTMMIDGGNAADSSLVYSYLTNTLKMDHIDYMVATHPHEDHIGGLAGALNACSVGKIFSPVTEYDSETFESLMKHAQKQGLSLTVPQRGETFLVGDSQVEVIGPVRQYDDPNEQSIVIRIVHGKNAFLFTGDAEWDAEHDLVDTGVDLSANVLKVGHHGSDTSSSYVFLREIMPEYAVISVGENNSYGHPTEAVLSRLRDVGAEVYRTDLQGDIVCISDGESIRFQTERQIEILENDILFVFPEVQEIGKESGYIGNRNSKKLHYADCASVGDMKEKNKVVFESREAAVAEGYEPCKRCNP